MVVSPLRDRHPIHANGFGNFRVRLARDQYVNGVLLLDAELLPFVAVCSPVHRRLSLRLGLSIPSRAPFLAGWLSCPPERNASSFSKSRRSFASRIATIAGAIDKNNAPSPELSGSRSRASSAFTCAEITFFILSGMGHSPFTARRISTHSLRVSRPSRPQPSGSSNSLARLLRLGFRRFTIYRTPHRNVVTILSIGESDRPTFRTVPPLPPDSSSRVGVNGRLAGAFGESASGVRLAAQRSPSSLAYGQHRAHIRPKPILPGDRPIRQSIRSLCDVDVDLVSQFLPIPTVSFQVNRFHRCCQHHRPRSPKAGLCLNDTYFPQRRESHSRTKRSRNVHISRRISISWSRRPTP